MIECSKDAIFRSLDAFFLCLLFLFQSVILNFFIINHFNHSPYPFLWFLGDFFCLLVFALTLYLAHRNHHKRLKAQIRSNSSFLSSSSSSSSENVFRPSSRTSQTSGGSGTGNNANGSQTSEYNWPNNLACFAQLSQIPMAYLSWLIYSILLIAKCATLFKSQIPQNLPKDSDNFFGPQIIKFCIGLSALIYSLLVEAHKDTQSDPVRNNYVNSLSFGIALEILDSVSFLSILIGSESGLMYSFNFETFIITLSSMNLMLPSIALYKLSISNYGRTYPVHLETLYKVLHLVFVNGSYLGVRLYLWAYIHTDTSIFIIKNIYSICSFIRDIPGDFKELQALWRLRRFHKNSARPPKEEGGGGGGEAQVLKILNIQNENNIHPHGKKDCIQTEFNNGEQNDLNVSNKTEEVVIVQMQNKPS